MVDTGLSLSAGENTYYLLQSLYLLVCEVGFSLFIGLNPILPAAEDAEEVENFRTKFTDYGLFSGPNLVDERV